MTSSPCSDSLSLGLRRFFLNPATSYKSPAHSSTGTRSGSTPSHCLSANGFMFYFTPLRGFFSPFHRCTISLSVTQEYLALRGGPRGFTRDSTCPMLLGIRHSIFLVDIRCFAHIVLGTFAAYAKNSLLTTGLSPSMVQDSAASSRIDSSFLVGIGTVDFKNNFLNLRPNTNSVSSHYPNLAIGLGCSRFARRYYGNRGCFLFLRLLRCFSSPGCLFPNYELYR